MMQKKERSPLAYPINKLILNAELAGNRETSLISHYTLKFMCQQKIIHFLLKRIHPPFVEAGQFSFTTA